MNTSSSKEADTLNFCRISIEISSLRNSKQSVTYNYSSQKPIPNSISTITDRHSEFASVSFNTGGMCHRPHEFEYVRTVGFQFLIIK